MAEPRVGVLGASSLVGQMLLPRLLTAGYDVTAYTRSSPGPQEDRVVWYRLAAGPASSRPSPQPSPQRGEGGVPGGTLPLWVCVAPIWVLPEHFDLLRQHGVQRIVALSSTSRYTKDDSSDPQEQVTAQRLAQAEDQLEQWARPLGVTWTVLRPTLIYGEGRDKNIAEMARFIRRFGFFPLFGQAEGLRQPIHADDVAAACVAALSAAAATNRAYNLSGAETLPYREMAGRVFAALGRPVRLLSVPLWMIRLALLLVRRLPRFRHWTPAMAERMNRDLVFDNSEAMHDLAWAPRPFQLSAAEVGGNG